MPSGKHKSKENTWTEKDLTNALQGEKPRQSKDDGKRRESREGGTHKRHSSERTHEEKDKDRQRLKQERSRKHREESPLDDEAGSSRGASGSKSDRDRDRTRKDRTRDKMKDDGDNDSGSNDPTKDRTRRSKEGDDRTKDQKKDEPSKDDVDRKERSKRSRDSDRNYQGEESRHRSDREREPRDKDVDKDERRRERGDRKRDKERDDRKRDKEDGENYERKRRGEKDDRKRDKDRAERNRNGHHDDKKHDRDERKHEQERSDRKRDRGKDERRREKRRQEEGDGPSEREKDKERDRRNRKDEIENDDDDEERERRRAKQERRERREKDNRKSNAEVESVDKENRRNERNDKEKSARDKKEKRQEDRDIRKQQELVKINNRSSSIQNASEVDEEIVKNDHEGDDNYEDDFEDYEDDFEEADEEDNEDDSSEHDKGKLLEIFEAINAENDDVARTSPYSRTPTEGLREEPVDKLTSSQLSKSSGEGRINFFAAKQKHVTEYVASKTKKRAKELENLIELDVASYDIFDLPPLNEYELYIKSYGQSDSKQAYVQCHDDIVEKEMQTEEIEVSTKWTQYPPDDFKGYGDGDENINQGDLTETIFSPHSVDSFRLSNFLQQAGQVCLILLEEMSSGRTNLMFKERNDINISEGFIQLATKLPFLEGRRILDINFNSIQTHLLLTAHGPNDSSSNGNVNDCLHGKGIVCFWNVNEPTQPQKILFCESSPRSCCFSPIKSSLVFAGLEDGSIVIWDIRESSSFHSTYKDKENQWVVRRPTFSTAGVVEIENHLSPVQSVLPISLPKESAEASIRASFVQGDPGGMAFQLASLDENGLVNIWVVIELDKPDEAGSEHDLGLAPGGRVKLVKTTSIQVKSPHREVFAGSNVQTSLMQFSTEDSNHFYVSTDRGWVIHCTRYGGRTQPKVYRPDIDSFVIVTAMDVSPWTVPIMLVGCADGSLRLHDLRKEHAIRRWAESTKGNGITQIKWSKSRPSLFYVLDTNSNFYIWDLLQKDGCPVLTEHFNRGRLLRFSISNDYESLGIGLPGRKSEIVLNYEGGIVELHKLKETFTTIQPDDIDRFVSLVDTFI